MKKILFLIFSMITVVSYSQEQTTSQTNKNLQGNSRGIGKGVVVSDYATVSLSSGISSPSSSFSNNSFASSGNFIELSGAYYFYKFGIGLSLGQISNPTGSNLDNFILSPDFPVVNNSEDWKSIYYGIGPEYEAKFGHFSALFSTKIGLMSVKRITLESNYNQNIDVSIPVYSLTTDKSSNMSYFSSGLHFNYYVNPNLRLFATANYISAFSNGITISKSIIHDNNKNGILDAGDFNTVAGIARNYDVTTTAIKPQTTNFGIGLSYIITAVEKEIRVKHKVDHKTAKLIVPVAINKGLRQRMENGVVTDTLKRAHIKILADELVNVADIKNDTLKKVAAILEFQIPEKLTKQVNDDTDDDGLSDSLEITDGKDNDCDSDTSTTKKINKGELVDAIAKDARLSKADAKRALEALTSHLLENSKSSNMILRIRLGPLNSAARTARNPQTGATIKIATKKAAKLKAGKALDNTVNRNRRFKQKHDSQSNKMNKGELVGVIAKDANLSKADAGKALNAFMSMMSKELNKGRCVKLIF